MHVAYEKAYDDMTASIYILYQQYISTSSNVRVTSVLATHTQTSREELLLSIKIIVSAKQPWLRLLDKIFLNDSLALFSSQKQKKNSKPFHNDIDLCK